MPENHDLDIQEVWATEEGVRHRVYRGRNPAHISWKMTYHKRHHPELVTPEQPPKPPKPGPIHA